MGNLVPFPKIIIIRFSSSRLSSTSFFVFFVLTCNRVLPGFVCAPHHSYGENILVNALMGSPSALHESTGENILVSALMGNPTSPGPPQKGSLFSTKCQWTGAILERSYRIYRIPLPTRGSNPTSPAHVPRMT